jgi:hypothetical protein
MLSGTSTTATILALFSYVVDPATEETADCASFMKIAPNIIHFPDLQAFYDHRVSMSSE